MTSEAFDVSIAIDLINIRSIYNIQYTSFFIALFNRDFAF